MKLEVGMYCYNKTNRKLGIGKIKRFGINNNVLIIYKNNIELVSKGNVTASFNIIDLIEIGDYVNGSEVWRFENKYNAEDNKFISVGIVTENCYLDYTDSWILEKDIKTIVTKEQFKNMEYKIGD